MKRDSNGKLTYTLIICALFDDAINGLDYIALKRRVVVSNELEIVRKGAIVAQIEIR